MPDKEFKTIDEQLSILTSRGLTVNDETLAKSFLLHNNYYRISGYTLTLRDHDEFFPMVTMLNIIDIYEFDHELRYILLKYIETIEVKFKSIYAYYFTKAHGSIGYRDINFFIDPLQHACVLANGDNQKVKRQPHEAYLKHFIDDLHQEIPLWAYVDLLTIADISFLFSATDIKVQEDVASAFGLSTNTGRQVLGTFMHSVTIIRNLCAHGSRLYNRLFSRKPSLRADEKALLSSSPDGTVDNSHLYGFVFIMRRLLDKKDFSSMKAEIVALCLKYSFVKMSYYGFRDDWTTVL